MTIGCPLCAAKEERIAELEELVAQLEGVPTQAPTPLEWGLTAHEARVIGVLLTRELATKEAIMAALYSGRAVDAAEPKIVDVFVCKARKKLAPFGIEIETVWGQGYRIRREQRDVLVADLKARSA